jgi:RimJ/RimL family protein N-acetyltransferase
MSTDTTCKTKDWLHPVQLEISRRLPVKPAEIELQGKHVHLTPLIAERDARTLFEISNGTPFTFAGQNILSYDSTQVIWQYMTAGPFTDFSDFQDFLKPQITATNGLCLCVFDNKSGQAIGVANFMNNFPQHLKIELGNIWYCPAAQGTKANTEATYLMLEHAFNLGYRRVEWKCDARNERSRRAALKMGFKFEGIQEQHLIIKGQNRDTAWYRILDSEWPKTRELFNAS